MSYAFVSYLRLVRKGVIAMGAPMDCVVPTGNFGAILGMILAQKCGVPIRHLIVASNENTVIHDFIQNGIFDNRERTLLKTVSPAIDILVPSNLERYLYLLKFCIMGVF